MNVKRFQVDSWKSKPFSIELSRLPESILLIEFPLGSVAYKAVIMMAPSNRYLCALSMGQYSGYRIWRRQRFPEAWNSCIEEATRLVVSVGLVSPKEAKTFTGGESTTWSIDFIPISHNLAPYLSRQLDEFGGFSLAGIYGGARDLERYSIPSALAKSLLSEKNMHVEKFLRGMQSISPARGVGDLREALSGFEAYLCGCVCLTAVDNMEAISTVIHRILFLREMEWPHAESVLDANLRILSAKVNSGGNEQYSRQIRMGRLGSVSVIEALQESLDVLRKQYPVLIASPEDC